METPIEIITGTALSNHCDYSFGDHMGAASIPRPVDGFMKLANADNHEFLDVASVYRNKVMSLFIDNIRLYRRMVYANPGNDANWVNNLIATNDLLALCSLLPNNRFVIFTSHEDTPIDNKIVVPWNVLGIHAVNAAFYSDKIHPFPYGLQRELGENDNRVKIMTDEVAKDSHTEPTKLLYINCGIERNKEREYLINFQGKHWATTRFDKDSKYFPYDKYQDFLNEIKDHKFMICPQGHGMDCHRNWESLYMRRVPIMLDHPYFRLLMQGFPVLFVKDWSDITDTLLKDNDFLYQQAQTMDLQKLNLNEIFKKIMEIYA